MNGRWDHSNPVNPLQPKNQKTKKPAWTSMDTCHPSTEIMTMRSLSIRAKAVRSIRARHAANHGNIRKTSGFTLLELLLVLAILVVLGGIVLVNFTGAQADANVNATMTQLNSLKQSVQFFQIRMNSMPKSIEELKDGPGDAAKKAKWTGPIITEIPKDAWGNEINFTAKGNGYEIRSGGLDGNLNTDDDITVSG